MKALRERSALLLPIGWLLGCSAEVTHVEQFALARQHSCALLDDGAVKCWGFRGAGALGDGNPVGAGFPDFQLSAVSVRGLEGEVRQLAVGETWSCALLRSGAVQCWGAPVGSPLLSVQDRGISPPTTVPGLEANVQSIAANGDAACALKQDGGVWCWGTNSAGQLAAQVGASELPLPVALPLPARLIAVGPVQVCAALVDNSIWCWGVKDPVFFGFLDPPIPYQDPAPVFPGILPNVAWQALAANRDYACGLAPDATVHCWGYVPPVNASDPIDFAPHAMNLGAPVAEVSLGEGYACAILKSGALRCWGNGLALGVANTAPRDCEKSYAACNPGTLITPYGVPEARRVGAGFYTTCAEQLDGEVLCWGENLLGTQGIGTRWDRYQPTPVLGL
ncbi:MAG: hypothetical protein SFV15_00090 [Polyangiaceae bacterium]|nr:hypothetical protein [Polyangiaceae bacterium]